MSSARAGLFSLVVLLALVAALAQVARASAHALSPPSLSIRERAPQHYDVRYRRTPLAGSRLTIDWPHGCKLGTPVTQLDGDQLLDSATLVCERALAGQTLRVFGLLELELSMLVLLKLEQTSSVRALLTPEQPSVRVPRRESPRAVLRDYVGMGIAHLLGGPDHILFVLGLLLLVRAQRARLLALTAFTLGHSVTLCLAALSVVRLPQAPVELGIAASLVVLALDVVRRPEAALRERLTLRRACLMAGGFGLLHGLGFASALRESGLPGHAITLALFGFNLGVELGQLLVVLALVPCLYLNTRLRTERQQTLRSTTAYVIGSLAAMWCIERAVAVL